MKIGIVTQPLLGNYGGILQNYALQQVLKQLGHEPITLDFQPGFTGRHYIAHEFRLLSNFLRGKSRKLISRYAHGRKHKNIINFVTTHLSLSHSFWNEYSPELIKQYEIDALIVGSDQVWRPRYVMRIQDMFLEWTSGVDIKRIAYAASFGTEDREYSDADAEKCAVLLKQFDGVSVREHSGIALVKRLGGHAEHVLDPTLLLGRQGFDQLIGKERKKSNSVGAYVLDKCPVLSGIIEHVKHTLKLSECIEFQANSVGMGPIEWIKTIRDSEFFITDSFHGTVFCILYHVPFITYVNTSRGADRFYSLLKPLGLANRLMINFDPMKAQTIAQEPIEWQRIDVAISELRSKSSAFLVKYLD